MQCVRRVTVALSGGDRGHDDSDPRSSEYVVAMDALHGGRALVAATSSGQVKVYDTATFGLQAVGKGHTAAITGAATFNTADGANTFVTSSVDRTLRLWDARSGESSVLKAAFEAWCCDVSADDRYIAAGTKDVVAVYDVRTGKQCKRFAECHGTEVTHVRFHPDAARGTLLLSGGEEGTVCMNDLAHSSDDDVLKVLNNQQAVASFTLFGEALDHLAVLSQIGTVSLWDLNTDLPVTSFPRQQTRFENVHALVGSFYQRDSDELFVVGSGVAGEMSLLRVLPDRVVPFAGAAAATTAAAAAQQQHQQQQQQHGDLIRCFTHVASNGGGGGGGGMLVTGAEDGTLCVWRRGTGAAAADAGSSSSDTGAGGLRRMELPILDKSNTGWRPY